MSTNNDIKNRNDISCDNIKIDIGKKIINNTKMYEYNR